MTTTEKRDPIAKTAILITAIAASLLSNLLALPDLADATTAPPAMYSELTENFEIAGLDTFRTDTFDRLQGQVTRIDQYFAETDEDELAISNSTFQLRLHFEIKDDAGFKLKIEPDFRADLNIPNLERRWKIFLTTLAPDELPSTLSDTLTASETTEIFTGISREFWRTMDSLLDASIGVKWRWPPVPYVKVEYKQMVKADKLKIFPRQRLFWLSNDGFGETTAIRLEYWFNDAWVTRSDSALTYSQGSRGAEWVHAFSLKCIIHGEEHDNGHAIAIRTGALGHYEHGHGQVDRYFLALPYRRTFLRDWIFLDLVPGIDYILDDDMLPANNNRWSPSFRIGVDILFAGDGK